MRSINFTSYTIIYCVYESSILMLCIPFSNTISSEFSVIGGGGYGANYRLSLKTNLFIIRGAYGSDVSSMLYHCLISRGGLYVKHTFF